MTKIWHFSLLAAVSVLVFALGCGSSNNPGGGSGVTEAEWKKTMESGTDVKNAAKPTYLESTAEETMAMLAESYTADRTKKALAEYRRRLSGKILEISAEGESPFLVLDGGTHGGKAYKVKCVFASDQLAALKNMKAGNDVRLEGKSDGVVNEGTLELKDCVLSAAFDAAPNASDVSKESSSGAKP